MLRHVYREAMTKLWHLAYCVWYDNRRIRDERAAEVWGGIADWLCGHIPEKP